MSATPMHLILARIPLLFIPFGVCILFWGWIGKKKKIKNFALALTICGSLFAIPVYLGGNKTGQTIMQVSEKSVHGMDSENNAAEVAFPMVLVTGWLGIMVFFFRKDDDLEQKLVMATTMLGLISSAFIFKTASM